jgi:hypothetical protein
MKSAGGPGRKACVAQPGTRAALGLRVTHAVKNRLDAAARQNGRTQSQEAEVRLENSFRNERVLGEALDLLFGHTNGDLLLSVFGTMLRGAAEVSHDQSHSEHWLDDHSTRKAAAQFLRMLAARLDGSEEPKQPSSTVPELPELLLRDACLREMNKDWLAQRRERQGSRAEWIEEFVRDLQRWGAGLNVITTHHLLLIESESKR